VAVDGGVLLFELLHDGVGAWAPLVDGGAQISWIAIASEEDSKLRAFVSANRVVRMDGLGEFGEWLVASARSLLEDPAATTQGLKIPAPYGSGNCLLDVIRPPDFHVTVFGAGHVGRAIVEVLGVIPCEVCWIDNRASLPALPLPNIEVRCVPRPEHEVHLVEPRSYCVVTTYSHDLDREICGRLLMRDDLPFVGLIGSRKKRASFEDRWSESGMSRERIRRLICPVGIPGIRGRSPGEIAVAVVAQMLEFRAEHGRAADA
jgi:xanthine dehydrogenase accessory factor